MTALPNRGSPAAPPPHRGSGRVLRRDPMEQGESSLLERVSITGLFLIALFHALHFARAMFLPMVLALLPRRLLANR